MDPGVSPLAAARRVKDETPEIVRAQGHGLHLAVPDQLRVGDPEAVDVVQAGDRIDVRVLEVDLKRKRISLSAKKKNRRYALKMAMHAPHNARQTVLALQIQPF